MESSSYTIHARVGSGALDKADVCFATMIPGPGIWPRLLPPSAKRPSSIRSRSDSMGSHCRDMTFSTAPSIVK